VVVDFPTGRETTEALMRTAPVPVVALADHDGSRETATVDALRSGAVAMVPRPSMSQPQVGARARLLLSTVKRVAAAPRLRARRPSASLSASLSRVVSKPRPTPEVVAVMGSTGGMMALGAVLGDLPPDFPVPILALQHPTMCLADILASWLSQTTALGVSLARDGMRLRPGRVYLANEDAHLSVGPGGVVRVDRSAPIRGNRPSADRLFESVAQVYGARSLAMVLTGSHLDGLHGLQQIRAEGGQVLLQNEATSAGFDLGAKVMAQGLPDFVLPLDQIPQQLMSICRPTPKGDPARPIR